MPIASPANATEGYFKDLFIDGGAWLTGRDSLAAAEYLGLSQEALALPYEPTDEHEGIQSDKIVGTDDDTNGCLLYPDGAPRFRLVQTNGGSATRHGRTLGEDGRQRVRDFYYGGGSYTGTCAGFFISTLAAYDDGLNENYYHIWPGRPRNTGLTNSYTGMFIEPDSPLLDYYDFGGDDYVASLYHNGGGYAQEDHPEWPAATEILARFDNPGWSMHDEVSCLAYKEDERSGRLVIIGSHPEGVDSGERRDLMAAMMQYAMAGQGEVQLKGELENGVSREMDQLWEDDDPLHARIGDQQYHHFYVDVPAGATELTVTLESEDGYDLDLYARLGDFAFESVADVSSATATSAEQISIASPEPGRWYVGVHCYTSVTETVHDWYTEYSGDVGVLNGVAYSIVADVAIVTELSVDLPEWVFESQGVSTGTVRATPAPVANLTVQLESSDPNRLSVPTSVVMPAGETNVGFALTPLDNAAFEGDLDVTIFACAVGYDCAFATVTITEDDVEPVDPSCGELGGACCAMSDGCDGGVAVQTWDCPGVCCTSGSCASPQSDPSGTGDTSGGDGDAGDFVGGPSNAGACQAVATPFSVTNGLIWLFVIVFAFGFRRSAFRSDSLSSGRGLG